MNIYLGTIAISIVLQIVADIKGAIYKSNNPNDITYLDIGKYSVLSKKILMIGLSFEFILRLVFLLIPGINIVYGCVLNSTLVNEEARRKNTNTRKVILSPQSLMKIYENQTSIEEAFKIDGLSEEEISEQVKLANQESGHTYITNDMYNDIKASQDAIEFLDEFEQSEELNLTRKEKIKLLREYRKAFAKNSKETLKPIEKTLKISNR